MDTTRFTMSLNPHWLDGLLRSGDSTESREQDNNNNGDNDDDDLTSATLLPDLHGESDILKAMHIRELSNHMPARAEGYAWTLAFTTTTMGFSLKSLYRSLSRYEGPVLLIIRDSEEQVFGAFSSCTLNPSDSFYGTGETYLFTFKRSQPALAVSASTQASTQTASAAGAGSSGKQDVTKGNHKEIKQTHFIRYPWTGDNLYFIKGNADSLAFGAGEGKYGLWLDEDLYHGSTQACKTFNNEPLTNHEDFVVCTLECWCFLWFLTHLLALVQDANYVVLVGNTFHLGYILTI